MSYVPPPPQNTAPVHEPIPNHLAWSIIATVLATCLCCPLGLVGIVVLVLLYVMAGHAGDWLTSDGTWPSRWLWYSIPYDRFGVGITDGMWIRFRVLMLGALGCFAVLAVIPRRHSWFSNMGGATLVVYLFHGFFVRRAEYAGYSDWAGEHTSYALWVTIALAIAVALFLASPPIVRVLTWFVDPIGSAQRVLPGRKTPSGSRGYYR